MSVVATIPMFILLAFALVVPFIVGIYVYRDAGRRGMNAILWALVAAAGPALIGLIIYLLVKGNYSDLRCPRCDGTVKEQFVVCPACGTKLRAACSNCAMPVEADWKVCPKCTQPLAGMQTDVQLPVRAKDKSIGKVLAIVLIIPALLIAILAFSFSAYSFGGSSGLIAGPMEEYFEEMTAEGHASEALIAGRVKDWINNLQTEADHAYALRYDYSPESGNEYFFLVYVPEAGQQANPFVDQRGSIFGTTLKLDLRRSGTGGYLFHISYSGKKAPNLKIMLDGKRLPCEVTPVDYNPTLFYIVPQYDEIGPDDGSVWMPERITVVKLINNHNEGAVVIEDEDTALNVLSSIDGAPYLDWEHDMYRKHDGSGGYDFKDGFDIIIEYKVHEDLVLHDDMLHCLVLPQYGGYYIIDDRPEDGRFVRGTDEHFYNTLNALFE